MFELSTYTPGTRRLQPGDVLVLYSDGITEAENKEGVFFDESGLVDVINRHWWEDAATLGKAIVTSVRRMLRIRGWLTTSPCWPSAGRCRFRQSSLLR